jgi:hypothetical protein
VPAPRSRRAATAKKPERTGLGGGSVDKFLNRPKRKRSNRFVPIGDGDAVVVRAIDTEEYFADGPVHPIQFERKDGSTYTVDRRCLDPDDEGEPCPGCRDDIDRRHKFWMVVIWRDAPLENKNGKVIGEADQLRLLSGGSSRLMKALNAKHKRRDLARRDIEVAREGDGFDTQYEVEWATDEDVPLSRDDKKIIADGEDIYEAFALYTAIPDEDEFYDEPKFSNDDDDDDDPGERSRRRGGVFGKTRKGRASSSRRQKDDDDDDDEPKPKGIAAARRAKSNGKASSKTIKRTIKKRSN